MLLLVPVHYLRMFMLSVKDLPTFIGRGGVPNLLSKSIKRHVDTMLYFLLHLHSILLIT